MKTYHKKRMRKLIAFLKVLLPKKFQFWIVREQDSTCGTVGCAIGWTPEALPDLVEACPLSTPYPIRIRSVVNNRMTHAEIGSHLFGISEVRSGQLFTPLCQNSIHPTLRDLQGDATPKQVAAMLEKFLALVESGEVQP